MFSAFLAARPEIVRHPAARACHSFYMQTSSGESFSGQSVLLRLQPDVRRCVVQGCGVMVGCGVSSRLSRDVSNPVTLTADGRGVSVRRENGPCSAATGFALVRYVWL